MNYYHYTPETRIKEIIESGYIKLATSSVTHKKELPCAWVSSNPNWEHTSTKDITDSIGNVRPLTFDVQLNQFGCARIEVNPIGLKTWGKLKYDAKMNLLNASLMEQFGIQKGGNPKEWFGSLKPIASENWIKIEVIRNGEWVEYDNVYMIQ